jgi:hypothetical protein
VPDCAHGGPACRRAIAFLRERHPDTGRRGDIGPRGRRARELERAHDRLIAMHLEKELRSRACRARS